MGSKERESSLAAMPRVPEERGPRREESLPSLGCTKYHVKKLFTMLTTQRTWLPKALGGEAVPARVCAGNLLGKEHLLLPIHRISRWCLSPAVQLLHGQTEEGHLS